MSAIFSGDVRCFRRLEPRSERPDNLVSGVRMDPKKRRNGRFAVVTEAKAGGATYTPPALSDFVARQIVGCALDLAMPKRPRVLDPAVGEGELLLSLLRELRKIGCCDVQVVGFETDERALDVATHRLRAEFPDAELQLQASDFLSFVLGDNGATPLGGLFQPKLDQVDFAISNPPYVRTQVMGAGQAQTLARQFGLGDRIDLYHAFLLAISEVLRPTGVAGIIVSNRFMTTRSGAGVRRGLRERFRIRHVWDLGDTKIFDAAVLPSVLLVEGRSDQSAETKFTSIYESEGRDSESRADDAVSALSLEGRVTISDGRCLLVQHGALETSGTVDGVWRLSTQSNEAWLRVVKRHTSATFGDIGKIRVGVKTCADSVFIRDDWSEMTPGERPELLHPLTTHHMARRFRAKAFSRQILYPHVVAEGKRTAIDLAEHPQTRAYLERYRQELESRTYVLEGGRKWFEIWVPQDPSSWAHRKLVFRDIAEEPTFWIDDDGSVVNGDCYWMVADDPRNDDLLWLACAVANSRFTEAFYDHSFPNKLYAKRRRFMTQYVEKFPLPDPSSESAQRLVRLAKQIYALRESTSAGDLEMEVNDLVWTAFGLPVEEVRG